MQLERPEPVSTAGESGLTILVCDDEELIRWSLCEHLESIGFRPVSCEDGRECLERLETESPSLVLLDLKMPRMGGLEALKQMRKAGVETPVIVLTAHGGLDSAIEATRLGASDYITKPFDLREVELAVRNAIESERLRNEVTYLRNRDRSGYGEFIGSAPSLDGVFEILERVERVDPPTILVQGESGTGKDVIARAIHARGSRSAGVFMEIDCASLPEQLIESELFGHERGAFTDARSTKRGLFEVAGNGVVFLDEIGEMSLGTQAKFLRALESRSFKRVGGVMPIPLHAAVIAATNRDLKHEVEEGRFRKDLYFRLNVIPIDIPPLRERIADIPELTTHFLKRFSRELGREVEGVDAVALAAMQRYPWPGNVRELRNVLERMVLLGSSPRLTLADLPPEIRFADTRPGDQRSTPRFALPPEGVDLESVERSLIEQALEATSLNQSAAARLLGLTRYALRYRMKKYGM